MKPSNESPDADEFGLLVAYLMDRVKEGGASSGQVQQEVAAIIGSNVGGQSRAKIVVKLKKYLKAAPKGV